MSTITVKDGTTIYYKDWGKGPVVTFSHGWPLNSDSWDGQMLFLAENGFRVVAHDRRGRSDRRSAANHGEVGFQPGRAPDRIVRWIAEQPRKRPFTVLEGLRH